ncbi:PREDICTED: titin-like [Acanthisitta chloris]|uniref:titin-like n=1 Tax=Acanthisitta chloris TaxID=57068 RepID=UPI0004F0CFAE|nr:PREDICTED: titin-like [Acanthisitta chloris]
MVDNVWHVVTQSPSLAEQPSKANLEGSGTVAVLACPKNHKPTFTQGLKCRSVLEGDPAFFQCKLVACPAPQMSWFHNNRPVLQDCRKVIRTESEEHTHHSRLEVWDVREHDAGSYRVFAINSEGSAESTASLLVARSREQQGLGFTGKAEWMQQSWECLLQQRQEDRLRVVLRCTGSPFDKGQEAELFPGDRSPARGMVRTIRFQSLPLVGSRHPELACGRERSGRVVDAEELLDEEIRWKLQRLREAKRAALKKKQDSLMSMSQEGSPEKPSPPKVAATMDGSEPFTVQVVKGYFRPKAVRERCQMPEIKITAPTPTPEQDTEMRETTQLSPDQAAPTIKHKFKFSFDMGNEPPQIVVGVPAHIHCNEGEEVVLECAVSGQPPPGVAWSLNGQSLSASERLRFEEGKNGMHRLHIQGVSVADAGQYCCVATNVAGTAQTASELTVQPRAPRLYSKDGESEELPAMDHVLHLQGLSIPRKGEKEQITCPKEEEAHLPWFLRLSPSPGEQLEDCEKTHFGESEMEETMVLDITEVYARQEMDYTDESVRNKDGISEMRQYRGKAVSEENNFGTDTTELHLSISREGHELVAKDSGHFSEDLEPEEHKVLPHTETLSWGILKSSFIEVQGKIHASEQSTLSRKCEDSQVFVPVSPVVQERSDVHIEESDAPVWAAITPDVPLADEPSLPHLQDHIASTPTKQQFGFYDFSPAEEQEEQEKGQEGLADVEQDIEVDDQLCKEEIIDAGDTTHWKKKNDRQMLQEMESDAGCSSLDLILTPSGIENSGQVFTEGAEVHLEEVHFREQLLPSETDETSITFDLKKFVEPFPAAEAVYTEQAQTPTALESVEVRVTGLISPVHQHDVLVEEVSVSEELRKSYRMQQEEVNAREEAQLIEIRRADLQIPNGDLGSVMLSAEERPSVELIHDSEMSVCGEDSLKEQIHSFLVETTADFQRGVQETQVWESGEQPETTDSQSDSFIMDLKKAAHEKKSQGGNQAEEDSGSGMEKVFETGMSNFTCEIESTDSPEEMLEDTQQEPNITKDFSFGQLLLGSVMDDPMTQKEQSKESLGKKRTLIEEASENSLDGEGLWENISAGPESSAVQVSELDPDLSLANYLRSTGMHETPDLKGTVQKEQEETITSLEVEEVTFSMVYDYYNNHQELARPFSPESEMSIELETGSREESPDSDRFYTPPSSVEIFETASSASYHTPLSTPECYSTPSEGSGYSTPPERYSTPSEGSGYRTPPECYSTPSEGSEYSMPPECYTIPSEGSVYSMAPEQYYTPSKGSKCNTPAECYFTLFEGPYSASGDTTPPEHYWTPTGEYMDALTMLPLSERRHQPPDQPQADVFRMPCEALEPSGREIPPAFLKALSRRRLCEGSTLRFVAEVVGVPKPGVKWYHNKSLLELDERVRVEKDGDKYILEITNVRQADAGQYLCHAVNIVGEAKSIAQVEVLPENGQSLALPPPVTHQHVIHFDLEQNTSSRSPSPQEILLEVELDENEVKEFEKQVKIITSPEFSPDKKTMVVSLDVLPLALLEQAGLAAEENEDVKIDFQITEMPPRFAVPIADITVTEGLEAVFECVVTGTPVPVVQWFRGNTCVTPATGKYVVSQKEGLHSLKIQTVGPSDGGWYHCQATNRLGEAMCKGSLVVMAQQGANAKTSGETVMGCEPYRPQKCDLLLSKTVSPGDQSEIELEFEFEPHRDDSEKAIQLLAVAQQEQEVEGEKCVNISFDVFAEPSQEERVEFRAEDSESCSFEFQVTEAPPRFVRLISDYSTFVGASACFQCLVTGSPHPSVCWYKDGVLLEGERYCAQEEQDGSHSLTIENLMQSDSGQYKYIARSLIVSSEEGRNEGYGSGLQLPDREKTLEFEPGKPVYFSKAKMKMEEEGKAPVFLKQISDGEVRQGDVARLSVTVTGSPTPKIQWFFNNVKLTSSTDCKLVFAGNDHSLILPYVGVQDDGEYTCVARNVHGETTCSAHLHVQQWIPGFPCFVKEPDSMRCAPGFTAVFEYTVTGKPCPNVMWFKGSEQLFSDWHHCVAHHPDGSGSLTVWDCMEEDTGLYTCRAVSALGEATCTAELLVLPEEHAVCRQSPALQHSAVAEDQSPHFYEKTGEVPAMEGALSFETIREPPALLQLQMSQVVHMLPREDVLPGLPRICLAVQSVEEMLTQVATTQECSGLLAESLQTLAAGPQGIVPAAAKETQLPGCLGTVAADIHLSKEKIIPKAAEQLAALRTEAAPALLQVSSTMKSSTIDSDQIQVLEGFQATQGELNAEPRFPSELAFTEDQTVPLENISSLETAEEDFAARVHEGWAVRFPLLLEENQTLEKELRQWKRAERQPHETMYSYQLQPSKVLNKENQLTALVPGCCNLDIKSQIRNALIAAVVSEENLLFSEWLADKANIQVQTINITKENKHTLCTYVVTAGGSSPIEIPVSLGEVSIQTADQKMVLKEAFYSLLCEDKHLLTDEKSKALPVYPSLLLSGKSCDETFELEPQQANRTMESEIPLEQPLSAQLINTVTGHGQIKDVDAPAATTDVASTGLPIEMPTEILKRMEKREEICEEEGREGLETRAGKVEDELVKESYPIIHSKLVDTVVEEEESVRLVSVITNVREVNWYFEGKLVSSGNKFKCLQDQDTYTLVISKVYGEIHQGEYTCEALNQGGKRASAAKLTVVKRGWIMGIKYCLFNTLLY